MDAHSALSESRSGEVLEELMHVVTDPTVIFNRELPHDGELRTLFALGMKIQIFCGVEIIER